MLDLCHRLCAKLLGALVRHNDGFETKLVTQVGLFQTMTVQCDGTIDSSGTCPKAY